MKDDQARTEERQTLKAMSIHSHTLELLANIIKKHQHELAQEYIDTLKMRIQSEQTLLNRATASRAALGEFVKLQEKHQQGEMPDVQTSAIVAKAMQTIEYNKSLEQALPKWIAHGTGKNLRASPLRDYEH